MTEAVLIAGGNLGDVEEALGEACELLEQRAGRVAARSGICRSAAWGFDAPDFLNQVWVLETTLSPEALLNAAEEVERTLGRTEKSRGGAYRSRTMDIDIVFYGDRVIDTPRLAVPHPLMELRRFVLEPLAEVMPGRRHPVSGLTVAEMLEKV